MILEDIEQLATRNVQLIIEVAHPDVTLKYGANIVSYCDYFIGSPSVLADYELEIQLKEAISKSGHRVFIPKGALWGAQDIQSMAKARKLFGVNIEMRFHPHSLKSLKGQLLNINSRVQSDPVTLYGGPIRDLCHLAPNNTNTMACAAIVGLGFDETIGQLISDPTYALIDLIYSHSLTK